MYWHRIGCSHLLILIRCFNLLTVLVQKKLMTYEVYYTLHVVFKDSHSVRDTNTKPKIYNENERLKIETEIFFLQLT
jgi:hypothetical protein